MPDAVVDNRDHTRRQVNSGLRWVSLSMAMSRSLRFLTTLILAWILEREMFGLIATANAVITIIAAVREGGLGQAFIQRKSESAEKEIVAANTIFVMLLICNVVLFVGGLFAAPLLADYFKDSTQLVPVLRVMFLAILIDSFLTTPGFILQKRLQFSKYAICNVVAGASNAVIAITLAFSGMGVWSLVMGQLGSRVIQTGLLIRLSGWRPRFQIDRQVARELFAYGKWLWAFSIISALGSVFDRLVIGHQLGMALLGAYGIAFTLCNMPASQIAMLVNRIAFPVLSAIKDDIQAVRRAYIKALSHVAFLALPASLGLAAVAHDFIYSIYGSKWAESIPVIEILAFYGLLLSIGSVAGPILKAIGKPQVILYTTIMHQAVLFAMIYVLAPWGLEGIAWAVVIPLVFSTIWALFAAVVYIDLQPRMLVAALLRPAIAAGGMYGAVRVAQVAMEGMSPSTSLTLAVGTGVVTYTVLSWWIQRDMCLQFLRTLGDVFGRHSPSAGNQSSAPTEGKPALEDRSLSS